MTLSRGKIAVTAILAVVAGVVTALVLRPASRRELKVGVIGNSPITSFRNENGELVGFNVEIAQAVCREMKRTCMLVETRLDQLIDQVGAGELDFAVASLVETPERAQKVIFTRPYYHAATFLIRRDDTGSPDPQVTAVVEGSVQARCIGQANDPKLGRPMVVKTPTETIESFLDGKSDAILSSLATTMKALEASRARNIPVTFTPMQKPGLTGEARIAVCPKHAALREELDQAIQTIHASGAFDRINTQYFPFRVR